MTELSRRTLTRTLAGLPFAGAALAGLAGTALAKAPPGAAAAIHPILRLPIGRFEVTFLSDGFIDFPYSLFTGASAEQVEAAARANFAARPGGLRGGFTQWLIRDGDSLILVDTGPAGNVAVNSGRLPAAMASIGIRPENIDAVILTHMHFDHTAGLVAGGRAVYNNAEIYADQRDVAHFTDPAKTAAAPELLTSSFTTAAEVVARYPRLQRIDGEREIARGVSIVDLSGHTPGHIGVRISDGGESLLLVGDLLFHPVAHPALPGVGIQFEADPAAVAASRARFFPRAAEEKALIAATHMPFPGLGRIVKDGGTLRWLPAEWHLG